MKLLCYYKETDDYIDKYGVGVDTEALSSLAIDIRDNCSYIEHKVVKGSKKCKPDILKCKTYSEVKIGEAQDGSLYRYTYDEIIYPRYLNNIIELLNGNVDVVEEIFNPVEDISIDERIKLLSNEIDNIDNTNVDLKVKKLEELKNLIEISKQKVKKVSDYYKEVQSLVVPPFLLGRMPKKEIIEVQNFFTPGISLSSEIDYEKIPVKIKR